MSEFVFGVLVGGIVMTIAVCCSVVRSGGEGEDEDYEESEEEGGTD